MSIVIPGALGLARNILNPKNVSSFQTNDLQVLNNDGVENYIRFSKCVADPLVNGWARYQNTAQSTPVSGTGGTPSANLTFTRTTAGNLDTTFGSFLISKAAANMQGYGVSYDFTIPPKYKSQQLVFSFFFSASVAFSAGDISFFVYDITGGALVSPAGGLGIGTGVSATQGTFTLTTSTSYRIIFHVTTTNASAYTLELDNVKFGPGSVTNLSATAPLAYNTVTNILSIPAAATAQNGYLTSTDWNTFNNKVATTRAINTTAPITGGGNLSADRTLAMAAATGAVDGYLTAANFTTFNGKQDAITVGALGAGNANGLSLSAGSLVLHAATTTQPGAITAAAQTFAGAKTFNGSIIRPAISGNASFRTLVEVETTFQSVTNLTSCSATFGGGTACPGYLFIITSSINADASLLFANYGGAGISAVANASGLFLPTDAGTGIYVTKGAATGVVTFKNRTGFTANISIQVFNTSISSISAWA